MTRSELVIIFRLRCNHNRMREHMYNRLKIGDSPTCQCGLGPENTNHILQQCPQFLTLRNQFWERPTKLDQKLYGSRYDLSQTVRFIRSTGLKI